MAWKFCYWYRIADHLKESNKALSHLLFISNLGVFLTLYCNRKRDRLMNHSNLISNWFRNCTQALDKQLITGRLFIFSFDNVRTRPSFQNLGLLSQSRRAIAFLPIFCIKTLFKTNSIAKEQNIRKSLSEALPCKKKYSWKTLELTWVQNINFLTLMLPLQNVLVSI